MSERAMKAGQRRAWGQATHNKAMPFYVSRTFHSGLAELWLNFGYSAKATTTYPGCMDATFSRLLVDGIENAAKLLGVESDALIGGLNLVEASELLGISPSTLRLRAIRGHIGCQRDGRAWRFYYWHLAEYIERREHPRRELGESGSVRRLSASVAIDEKECLAEAERLGLV